MYKLYNYQNLLTYETISASGGYEVKRKSKQERFRDEKTNDDAEGNTTATDQKGNQSKNVLVVNGTGAVLFQIYISNDIQPDLIDALPCLAFTFKADSKLWALVS